MPHVRHAKTPRLRQPATPEAVAKAAAAPVFRLDGLRGKCIPNKLLDPQARGELIAAAAFTTVKIAANMVGVSEASVYDLRKRDPEFEAQWQAARARMIARWEMTMSAVAANPRHARCVDAAKFMLGAHKPELYRQRSEIEVTASEETISIVREAAQRARERRRLAVPVAEIVLEGSNGNDHGDVAAIIKAAGGNGNGNGNGHGDA